MSDVTQLLEAANRGDKQAAAELMPLVYDELRQLAAAKMANEKPGQTLDATALVHEAYLRLVPGAAPQAAFANRGHFFAAAAEAMRRILVDRARTRASLKRGGDRRRVDLIELPAAQPDDDLLALDEALEKLSAKDRPKARLVELRYFAGLTMEQSAETLGISVATAHRWWNYARAWMHQEIAGRERSENS